MRDHVHAPGVDAELLDEASAAVRGVDDDRIETAEQPPLRGELADARLAGRTSWAVSTSGRPRGSR